MTRRRDRLPGLEDESVVVLDDVLEHLRLWRSETEATIEAVRSHREEVERGSNHLENPRAVIEYVDFFSDFFAACAAEFDRVLEELPQGIRREHIDALRQIANNSALEQRRSVMFRDKWINKILPFEQMRPLLDGISMTTRDQLSDYRELTLAAARLETLGGAALGPEGGADPDRTLRRRELFNKLFKR